MKDHKIKRRMEYIKSEFAENKDNYMDDGLDHFVTIKMTKKAFYDLGGLILSSLFNSDRKGESLNMAIMHEEMKEFRNINQ